jgi:hypothetical protein
MNKLPEIAAGLIEANGKATFYVLLALMALALIGWVA